MSEPKTFENYITELVGEESVYVTDRSVDAVGDYKGHVEELFALTEGALELQSFEGEEEVEVWHVVLGVGGAEHRLTFDYNRGWIDNDNLVLGLNKILSENDVAERICWFWAADSFGQEVGFFCGTPEQIASVFKYAGAKNKRVKGVASKLRQVSDGINDEGFADL